MLMSPPPQRYCNRVLTGELNVVVMCRKLMFDSLIGQWFWHASLVRPDHHPHIFQRVPWSFPTLPSDTGELFGSVTRMSAGHAGSRAISVPPTTDHLFRTVTWNEVVVSVFSGELHSDIM